MAFFDDYNDKASSKKSTIKCSPSKDLLADIDKECAYLGITRAAWLVMAADREIRRARRERNLPFDPDDPRADIS
jgi:hypothetical protein